MFRKISDNTNCNCLDGTHEDLTSLFVRKVRKAPDIKDADFRNQIELNKIPTNNDCNEICGMHGVSIEIWNDESEEVLKDKYRKTAAFGPNLKKSLAIFKFNHNNGLIKHTPEQFEYNEFHYDFYKHDIFKVSELNLIKMLPLKEL
ncbi:hypothetical protein ACKW6Q_11580 [Chryseobacterium kwangjuense]|uniref:Uncharacterized protein n=1 Tax=Chryseobacterium kwangjuense TaxID=267125 RepID=A0ABW9K5B2_9FLAO